MQPLRFIDRELFPALVESTRCVASWLGVSPRSLALVANATCARPAPPRPAGQRSLLFWPAPCRPHPASRGCFSRWSYPHRCGL
jgi:hypothetical protein